MADPISIMVVGSMAASAGAGVMGAMGARAEADSMSAMSNYQSVVARNNMIIANNNAKYALQVGARRAEDQSFKTAQILGQQKAKQGASGVDVNSGSAVDVRASTAQLGELDRLTVLNDAEAKASSYRAQGMNFAAEERLDLMKSDYYQEAGDYKVATSLLGAASSVSDKWLGYKSKGLV